MRNPKTDRYKKIPPERGQNIYSGRIIKQKKQCLSCRHFREAEVVKNNGYSSMQVALLYFSESTPIRKNSIKKDPTEENKVFGVCEWNGYWKILYKAEKPRKCQKIPG